MESEMPSGPPELHDKWCKYGPHEGGDFNAQWYLKRCGWTLEKNWTWTKPRTDYEPSEDEFEAIKYLIMEWDFGGINV